MALHTATVTDHLQIWDSGVLFYVTAASAHALFARFDGLLEWMDESIVRILDDTPRIAIGSGNFKIQ
eukprot:4811825-Pleurochrysis_carterae.AAC.1